MTKRSFRLVIAALIFGSACLFGSFTASSFADTELDSQGISEKGRALLDAQVIGPQAQSFLDSCKRAYARDDFDGAIDFAKEAIELEPEASVCQLWLGIAYSEKTESGFFVNRLLNARKCKKAFERGVELDATSLDAREGLIEYHVRAPGVAGGSAETAWEHAEFIMQNDSVRGWLAVAYIHERKEEDTAAAEEAFLNAVAADSTNVTAQLRLAGFYARHESFNKAESVLVAAAASGDREALLNLGWFCQLREGLVSANSMVLEAVRSTDSQDPEMLFFAATAFYRLRMVLQGDSMATRFRDLIGESECSESSYLAALGSPREEWRSTRVAKHLEACLTLEPYTDYNPCWADPHLTSGIGSYRQARARVHYLVANMYHWHAEHRKEAKSRAEKALELDATLWPARELLETLE